MVVCVLESFEVRRISIHVEAVKVGHICKTLSADPLLSFYEGLYVDTIVNLE